MRVVVMGTGAVGAFFGGRLAQAGEEVVFVARGATLDALQRSGLRIESARGVEVIAAVRAVADPAAAGVADLVLVCVKAYDTRAAAEALRPAVGPRSLVVSLQNGIENEEMLAEILRLPPLLGALTHIGVEMTAPGVIWHDSRGQVVFGEMDGSASVRSTQLAALFERAGIAHHLSHHIRIRLWEKLAWNAAFNATTALTQRTVGGVLASPDGQALVRATMNEVMTVGRSAGVDLQTERIDETLVFTAETAGHVRTSMLQDRERGRRLEYDALNGAVLRTAARTGMLAPLNRTLYALLATLDRQLQRTPSPAIA